MKLEVKRLAGNAQYTIGKLFVDGASFCDTLEPPVREYGCKVPGKTAVPAGKYKCLLNFSTRFKRVLPLLIDVPNFEGVRIHPGNSAEDTEGCLLVGFNRVKGKVLQSRLTFETLFQTLFSAEERGEKIEVIIH